MTETGLTKLRFKESIKNLNERKRYFIPAVYAGKTQMEVSRKSEFHRRRCHGWKRARCAELPKIK